MVGESELIEQRVTQAGIDVLETQLRIAVLIPCFNEESTIAQVVKGVRAELPMAQIYVFDNNSTDGTVESALENGAVIFHRRSPAVRHICSRSRSWRRHH